MAARMTMRIVGEEALNFRFHDLVADLETMRRLNVTADFYIQSFAGLERHYGKEAAAAIESYADIRVYGGLNSFVHAKHVSDQLAEETIRKQEASYRSSFDELSHFGTPHLRTEYVWSGRSNALT